MPERKHKSELAKAAEKAERLEKEDQRRGLLDDPNDPEHGDPWRQTAFLVAIFGLGFALNLAAIIFVSGGK
jgi:hypothetical protein